MAKQNVQDFIEQFEEAFEDNKLESEQIRKTILENISNRDELKEALPELKKKIEDYKVSASVADGNIKTWQETKKMWTNRAEALLSLLGELLKTLKINSFKPDKIKLATSSRTSLDVDQDWLLGQYTSLQDAWQAQLPDYIKVSLTVDKNKLFAFVKKDDTMLVNNPDKIHTKVSESTTIK